MSYLFLVVVKIIDNIVSTMKGIAVYKNQKVLSSVYVVISQLLFYLVVAEVINDNSLTTIFLVSVASGIGNFIAFLINDKFKRDDKWWVLLTTKNIKDVKKLCVYLRKHDIKYIANDGYSYNGDKTINVIAFSRTKGESKLINDFLRNNENKYLKEIRK